MPFQTQEEKPFDPSVITEGGVSIQRGPSKEELKREQEEQKIALEEERVYRKGAIGIKDLIAPSAMKVEPSFLRLGDVFCRTLFVVTYPRYVTVGWASPLINLSAQLDIAMFFYPMKADIVLKQLKRKVGILEATIS